MDDPIGRQLLLQAVLIGINAFFASAEMAVVSLNVNMLRKSAEDGDKKAAKLLRLAEEPTQFLSAIQIAITLAGFLASAFAAENFSDRLVAWLCDDLGWNFFSRQTFDTVTVVAITLLLSYFTLVLGELVPKRVAMHSPEKVARITSPVVSAVKVILKPIIWMLTVSTNGVLRIFGIKPGAESEAVTEDEIRLMVDIGEESGAIDSKASEMIDNIFEFDNNVAKTVMTRTIDITSIRVDLSDDEVFAIIKDSAYSRFPVWEDDINDIKGILYAKDYFIDRMSGSPKPLVELLRPAFFVPETVKCDALFFEMQDNNRHIAVVVDEYGAVSGIVTLEDLVEEIFGNIYDEYDEEEKAEEESDIEKVGDNLWRVAGSTETDRLADELGVDLPDTEDYDTLGGMVLSVLTEIPEDGTTVEADIAGLHISVDRVCDRRIESALVSVIATDDAVTATV